MVPNILSTPSPAPIVPSIGMMAPTAPMPAFAAGTNPFGSGNIFSNLLQGFGGLSGLASAGLMGFMQYNAYSTSNDFYKLQESQYGLQARAQNLQARRQAIAVRNQAEQAIGKAKALFAARGVTVGLGSAQQAVEASDEAANEDIEDLMFGSDLASSSLKAEGTILRSKGRLKGIGQLAKAGSLLHIYQSGLAKDKSLNRAEEAGDFYEYGI